MTDNDVSTPTTLPAAATSTGRIAVFEQRRAYWFPIFVKHRHQVTPAFRFKPDNTRTQK